MTEHEFALGAIEILSGLFIPNRHVYIPEVPRDSHNDHTDLLVIFPDSRQMLNIEFKMGYIREHLAQILRDERVTGIRSLGINSQKWQVEKYGTLPIFNLENEISVELLNTFIFSYFGEIKGTHFQHTPISRLYWWGYVGEWAENNFFPCQLEGTGKRNTERLSLYQLFEAACMNIFRHNRGVLDFDLLYPVLGVYAESTARKHYRDAVRKFKEKIDGHK